MTNFNFEPDDNNWDSSPNETSWSESQWRHYLRGKLYFDHKKNKMIVKSLNNQDSASLLPYSEANSLIILEPNEKKLRKGSKVKVFLLNN